MTADADPSATSSPKRSAPFLIGIVCVLLTMWPLSLGPVCWLYDHGYISDAVARTIGILYRPLSWLAMEFDSVEKFIEWYLQFWRP